MTRVTNADRVVTDYLNALRDELATAPLAVARDVIADVSEHIEAARADGDDDVRAILSRLGTPAEIAAAARESDPQPQPAAVVDGEFAMLAVLGVGAFVLPFLLPLVGAAMIGRSPWWTAREKRFAWASVLVPGACTVGGRLLEMQLGMNWVISWPSAIVLMLAPAVTAVVLLRLLSDRRRAMVSQ